MDVVAPGTDLWSTLAINLTGTNGLVAGTASGTSFAAPHVTGVAALLYGAAVYPLGGISDKGTFLSTDHKLIKAIIINSADKIPGLDANGNAQSQWQPGEMTTTNGVPNAIVPLNYAVGSGSVNGNSAFLQYSESGNSFWDLNTLAATGSDIYYPFGIGKFSTSDPTQMLSGLTATLVWDRHVDFTVDTSSDPDNVGTVSKNLLSDLDLILQEEVAPGDWEDVYMSGDTGSTVDQEDLFAGALRHRGLSARCPRRRRRRRSQHRWRAIRARRFLHYDTGTWDRCVIASGAGRHGFRPEGQGSRMQELGKLVFIAGVVLAIAGLVIWKTGGLGGLGRMPGDISVHRPGMSFYFPITTCIIISLVLTLVMWILRK